MLAFCALLGYLQRFLYTLAIDIYGPLCTFRMAFKFLCSFENNYFMKSSCTPRIYRHMGAYFMYFYCNISAIYQVSNSYQWNTIYICEIVISAVKYKLVFKMFIYI